MLTHELQHAARHFVRTSPGNLVRAEDAMTPDLEGLRIFEDPLLAVGSVDDPLFVQLRQETVVHPDTWLPRMWTPDAAAVLSFFLPFTPEVRRPNAKADAAPADAWLHGRMEGQDMVVALGRHLCAVLVAAGYSAVLPSDDPRFCMLAPFRSNWSERHVAYICGLGTFGMCKGIITEKGMAGRLASIITSCPLPPTPRPYTHRYGYCQNCGLCAKRCPAHAIAPTRGMDAAKAHPPCKAFLDEIRALPPRGASARMRYGCGKCQVAVPCESGIPTPRKQIIS